MLVLGSDLMKFRNYFIAKIDEMIRDFTAFGNPVVLGLLILLFLGLTLKSLYLIVGLIAIDLVCNLIKLFFFRHRPVKKDFSNFLEKIDAGSFPSIHSARSSFVFISFFFLTSFPVNWIFLLLILVVGLTRILLKKHYLFDVLAGYAIGLAVYFVWQILL